MSENIVRFILTVGVGVVAVAQALAAPFDEEFEFTQPDGTRIKLHGRGDEFYAVFETLDGHTVVFDPIRKAYCFARQAANGELVSTGVLAHRNPAALKLAKRVRMSQEARRRQVEERQRQWEAAMEIKPRWEALKAARRKLDEQAQAAPGGAGEDGPQPAPPSSTTTGLKVGFTILIDFSDDPATIPQTNVIAFCNGDGYTGYGNNGSVKEYYYDNSGGLLTYTNTVTFYIRAPQPKSYYNDTTQDSGVCGRLLLNECLNVMTNLPNYETDILPLLEPLTVDSNDRVVACNVFFAGANSGVWSKGLWPHSWSLASPVPLPGSGKSISKYQITNLGTSLRINTFCHENGHMLCGFPDIYDYGGDSIGGAGRFCLMNSTGSGTNPEHICGYLKRAAGWITPIELTSTSVLTATVTAWSGSTPGQTYIYRRPGMKTEYFLIENRQQTGRDASLPAAGVAIWHCDELGNRDNQSLVPNSSHANYECSLMQADNLWHFQNDVNSGDSKDLYYAGNTAAGYKNEFTDYSMPGARWWDGTLSGVRFRNFSASSATMTFDVGSAASVEDGVTTLVNGTNAFAAGAFTLGTNGSFNTLIITNGGVLTVTNGGAITLTNGLFAMSQLGDGILANTAAASSNSAIVTGAGSLWSNAGALYIGAFGSANSLTIRDGGRVRNTAAFVGYDTGADSNAVLVTDAGSVWSNAGALFIGSNGSGNSLVISNGAQVFSSTGYLGAAIGADGNNALVSGPGSLWTNSGGLFIGNFGSGNGLTVAGGAQVFNGFGYVGNNTNATGNNALVAGAGSRWRNANNLLVGNNGFGNSLVITNGGLVEAGGGFLGYAIMASNNTALVSGSGSTWSNSGNFYVGYIGSDNSLIINDGGRVLDAIGNIGLYTNANNTVLVTDSGSVWSNSSYIYVGNYGFNNRLTISNGGQVFATYSQIGVKAGGDGNSALITDPGSLWSNSSSLYMGNNAVGNRMTVSNGAQVFSTAGYIGYDTNASDNAVQVTGAGSLWRNSADLYVGRYGSYSRLDIRDGGEVNNAFGYVGYYAVASNNSVVVANPGSVWSNSGSLYIGYYGPTNSLVITNGGQVFSTLGYAGGQTGSINNSVLVSGAGSVWANKGTINIGSAGGYNRMIINNGGAVMTATGIVGNGSTGGTNTVLVNDPGSLWSNLVLTIGGSGSSNRLIIANGGRVAAASSSSLGASSGSSNNAVLVTDAGSVWSAGSNLYVGSSGSSNSLTIANGGRVINGVIWNAHGYIGYNTSSSNNTATVAGAGSVWTNNGNLYVGYNGRGNRLIVTDGGTVLDNYGHVGYGSGSSNNSALVTGSGSLWSNLSGSVFYVGMYGSSNSLTVADGGMLASYSAFVGWASSASNNTALVTGTGSIWKTGGSALSIGNFGSSNSLTIAAGGRVLAGNATIGNFESATGNAVWVTGTGSLWSNSGDLCVGASGVFSRLTVANGGQVRNAAGIIGSAISAVGNSVFVTDAGSLWTNSGDLYVGSTGSFNRLTISDGGRVVSQDAFISRNLGASNNSIVVTGSNSVMNSSAALYVGYYGSGDQLIVSNGAQVVSLRGYIGHRPESFNNLALITGAGSLWTNADTLSVGRDGVGNQLIVTNGGRVVAANSFIGVIQTGTNNLAVVSGAGSMWINLTNLHVGQRSSFNGLTVSDGGQVLDENGFIGTQNTVSNNWALVTGAGSLWSNSVILNVGCTGWNSRLTVEDSGTVIAPAVLVGTLAASSNNIVTLSGGSLFATNSAGTGLLDICRGTLMLNSGTVMVNQLVATNFADSVVSFNGGTLHSGGSTVNNSSIFQVGNGTSTATLHLMGGNHSFADGLFINTNAWLTGTGAITGVITNSGTIAPGNSAGILAGNGDLTLLGDSLLLMELAGTDEWLYDQINLTGALHFGGTLTLRLLDGFNPVAGDRFDLFDFNSSSGFFIATNLPSLDPLLYWDLSALYTTGEIQAGQMTGSLQVTITPQTAIDAGAKWQVDGDGNWHDSGEIVTGLLVGAHTVSYTNLTGWIKPADQLVAVGFNEVTITNGAYELIPTLLAAVSMKTHGAAGAFELPLTLDPSANPTVEPRSGGPTQIIFTFNKPVMAADGLLSANEFTLTNATFSSASAVSSNLTLNLTAIPDQSRVTVVMNGLTDLAGNPLAGTNAVRVRALYGDVNQSGSVNLLDLAAEKNQTLKPVTVANFLCDVNVTGSINLLDLTQVKNNQLHTVILSGEGSPALILSLGSGGSAAMAPAVTLGEALGAPGLEWVTDGDELWTPTVAPDGSLAAWSGRIGDLNVSWVETTVMGPGTLSFEWSVSSEPNGDYLTFSMDGVDQPGGICGEVGWQRLTASVPVGAHRLRWTYGKNRDTAAGVDAGWLRRVSFPASP